MFRGWLSYHAHFIITFKQRAFSWAFVWLGPCYWDWEFDQSLIFAFVLCVHFWSYCLLLLSTQLLASSPVSYSEHIWLLFLFWISASSGKFLHYLQIFLIWFKLLLSLFFFLMFPLLPVFFCFCFALPFSSGAHMSISGISLCILSLSAIRKKNPEELFIPHIHAM